MQVLLLCPLPGISFDKSEGEQVKMVMLGTAKQNNPDDNTGTHPFKDTWDVWDENIKVATVYTNRQDAELVANALNEVD